MKKSFSAIMVVALVLVTIFALSACNADDVHTHSYGEWNEIIVASCSIEGKSERTCTDCNEKEEKVIQKLPHILGDFVTDTPATCMAVGSKSKHCSVCKTKTDITEIPMSPHTLGEFEIDTAATCTAVGSKSKHCSVCETKTDITEIPIDSSKHNYEGVAYKDYNYDEAADCQHSKTCNDCKKENKEDCTLTVTGDDVLPTESEKGYVPNVCTVCEFERKIVNQPSRNKQYSIKIFQNKFSVRNLYDSIINTVTLEEAMEALEAHRAWGADVNRDCTIALTTTNVDHPFIIPTGQSIILKSGKYTISGTGGSISGTVSNKTKCMISVQNGADVTLDGIDITATLGTGVEGAAIYVENGTLTVKNSNILGSSGMENRITGIIMIKMGCTLNIGRGAVIRNTKDVAGIKSFAISTPEISANTEFYAKINITDGLVESQHDSAIYGYNIIFNMSGGEVKNNSLADEAMQSTAIVLMGNSIANITGGKIYAKKVGINVENDSNINVETQGEAAHILEGCAVSSETKIKTFGKGTLNGVPVGVVKTVMV